jgi:hypothetical protein
MPNTLRDGQKLACVKCNRAVREFDNQLAIDAKEGLVRIGMAVPRKGFSHDAQADFVVVDGLDPLIVIRFVDAATDLKRIDRLRCSMCSVVHPLMFAPRVCQVQ